MLDNGDRPHSRARTKRPEADPGLYPAFARWRLVRDARRLTTDPRVVARAKAMNVDDDALARLAVDIVIEGTDARVLAVAAGNSRRPTKQRSVQQSQKVPSRIGAFPRNRGHRQRRKPAGSKRRQPACGGEDSEPGQPSGDEPPGLVFVNVEYDDATDGLVARYKVDGLAITATLVNGAFVAEVDYEVPHPRASMAIWDAITADVPRRVGYLGLAS